MNSSISEIVHKVWHMPYDHIHINFKKIQNRNKQKESKKENFSTLGGFVETILFIIFFLFIINIALLIWGITILSFRWNKLPGSISAIALTLLILAFLLTLSGTGLVGITFSAIAIILCYASSK